MAGFLGMGNFTKPGKGIKKGADEKKRFFQFFDLYFRKFGSLIKLNLIFILFCLPIFTIGPATAGMMKVIRYYNEGKPVFLFSDFWDAFKQNFGQSFLMSIVNGIIASACYTSLVFYYGKMLNSWGYAIPLGIIAILSVLFIMMNFYTYLLIVTVDLKFIALLKNAFSMIILGIKSNFFTIIFTGLVVAICFIIPIGGWLLLAIVGFSTIGMIICFNSFQHIYSYLIKPYYDSNGLENPYEKTEDTDSIFEDAT
ncbi:DUF624 domain-containing protein [Paludicola sp. MB14-C6]|uniref:YesL family protein n=1 Tax=Paludihabitans sp. MB14-C6 TaxID=3070656 RepID=UPI0027DD42EC|nr:DUF624 domain-containing protein [Paludicola sp. MB14-C6]WMJ23128.1 DUF624 domain-containing protein [Paludicola sp. MB14-C6]